MREVIWFVWLTVLAGFTIFGFSLFLGYGWAETPCYWKKIKTKSHCSEAHCVVVYTDSSVDVVPTSIKVDDHFCTRAFL